MQQGSIISILTNFIFYWFMHPQFQTDCYHALSMVATGLYDDMTQPEVPFPPTYDLNISQQIISQGYLYEEHTIQTEDGYLLKAFRVPAPQQPKANRVSKGPVYMQHGLLDDGGTWFFNNKTLSMALQLVDQGYDIWATNSRGNVFSNRHVKWTPEDKQFW